MTVLVFVDEMFLITFFPVNVPSLNQISNPVLDHSLLGLESLVLGHRFHHEVANLHHRQKWPILIIHLVDTHIGILAFSALPPLLDHGRWVGSDLGQPDDAGIDGELPPPKLKVNNFGLEKFLTLKFACQSLSRIHQRCVRPFGV